MQEKDPMQIVARIPLFSALGTDAQASLARLIRVRRYAPRQTVVWEGESGGVLFMTLSGYLKAVTAGHEGKEVLLSVMGPGEVFGELSVLDGQPRSASVVALEAAELASIERDALLELLRGSPELSIRLLEVMTQRLRSLTKRCETISSQDVPNRLAQVLLSLAQKHGQLEGRALRIPVRLSQQDLGSMVGATRESVNKQLRLWSHSGLLQQQGGRLVISDFRAFQALTQG